MVGDEAVEGTKEESNLICILKKKIRLRADCKIYFIFVYTSYKSKCLLTESLE